MKTGKQFNSHVLFLKKKKNPVDSKENCMSIIHGSKNMFFKRGKLETDRCPPWRDRAFKCFHLEKTQYAITSKRTQIHTRAQTLQTAVYAFRQTLTQTEDILFSLVDFFSITNFLDPHHPCSTHCPLSVIYSLLLNISLCFLHVCHFILTKPIYLII